MLRNCIAVVAGTLLNFVLSVGGTYLNGFVTLRNVGNLTQKEILTRLVLWQTVVVGPAVAVIVGVFVASLVQKRFWWLTAGAFLTPLVYRLVTDIHDLGPLEIGLFTSYVALACVTAFVVSRFKQPHPI